MTDNVDWYELILDLRLRFKWRFSLAAHQKKSRMWWRVS